MKVNLGHAIARHLRWLNFDPLKDFAPITLFAMPGTVFASSNALPISFFNN